MSFIMPNSVWTVYVEDWKWIYTFSSGRKVAWVDPLNGMKGRGSWTIGKTGKMVITWTNSKTVEEWEWPVNPRSQTGTVRMNGKTYDLWATASQFYAQPGDVIEHDGHKYVVYPDEVRSISFGEGTIAWVCRNPGNIRNGDSLGAYPGKKFQTKSVGAFAIFPDEETGAAAIRQVLKRYGHVTISQAINKYAPIGDGGNKPDQYGASVAKAVGVPAGTYVDTLTDEQMDRFVAEVRRVEGWRKGWARPRDSSDIPPEVRRVLAPHLSPPTEEELRNSSLMQGW